MDCHICWETEEEGRFIFDAEGYWKVYKTGGESAEISLRERLGEIPTEYLVRKCFELLWEEGMEEVVLVGKKGTPEEQLLCSLTNTEYVYSEYMMKKEIEDRGTEEKEMTIRIVEEPSGFICRNSSGTFFGRLLPHPKENSLYLYEFEVEESMRNQGVGTRGLRQLLQDLAEWENAPEALLLQVGSYNEPAVHLYQKLGFEITEELCYYTLSEEDAAWEE